MARCKRAAQPGRWEELVPLGALLADFAEFEEAEWTYHRAASGILECLAVCRCRGVCFELGVLWGDALRNHSWLCSYHAAIEYLPRAATSGRFSSSGPDQRRRKSVASGD